MTGEAMIDQAKEAMKNAGVMGAFGMQACALNQAMILQQLNALQITSALDPLHIHGSFGSRQNLQVYDCNLPTLNAMDSHVARLGALSYKFTQKVGTLSESTVASDTKLGTKGSANGGFWQAEVSLDVAVTTENKDRQTSDTTTEVELTIVSGQNPALVALQGIMMNLVSSEIAKSVRPATDEEKAQFDKKDAIEAEVKEAA